jgi:hypothetical protein
VHLVVDENCDFSIVLELRAAGYDVVAIAKVAALGDFVQNYNSVVMD